MTELAILLAGSLVVGLCCYLQGRADERRRWLPPRYEQPERPKVVR